MDGGRGSFVSFCGESRLESDGSEHAAPNTRRQVCVFTLDVSLGDGWCRSCLYLLVEVVEGLDGEREERGVRLSSYEPYIRAAFDILKSSCIFTTPLTAR
jgi:hypothetical protein